MRTPVVSLYDTMCIGEGPRQESRTNAYRLEKRLHFILFRVNRGSKMRVQRDNAREAFAEVG